jgi:hypothetical protein
MRTLIVVALLSAAAFAQEAQPAQEAAASPVAEQRVTGYVEAGYRWLSDVGGDFNTYRSVVNLGEGPKLLGVDFSFVDPARKLFDKLTVRGTSWGGDPHNTAHVGVERDRSYRLSFDYRNIAYFNFLPSFANPTVERGILLNQRSFDIERRMIDTELELLPGRRVVPYLAYSRDWGSGSGLTDFVSDANEYAVANGLRDKTDNYRGGVRIELRRFHATLEQGAAAFKDDQSLFNAGPHLGNRTSLFLGQRLFLSDLLQAYRVRGDSVYSKGLVTASPVAWLNLYGRFLYSRPTSDVDYSQRNAGLFALSDPPSAALRLIGLQQSLYASEAKQPHTSGSLSAELRPHRRVRVFESVMTDRFHTTGAALYQDTYTPAAAGDPVSAALAPEVERLVFNYNRQEANLLVDVTDRLTLRGGHRYVWGDSRVRAPQLSQTGTSETGELKTNVGLAGFSFRPVAKLSLQADFEAASSDRSYFRTSLHDYYKLNARARYQVVSSIALAASFSLLDNDRDPGSDYRSRDNSLSIFWTPGGGKRISLTGDYTRSTFSSNNFYLDPLGFRQLPSSYRENAHIGTGILDVNFPGVNQGSPKLSLGGSMYVSSGSRPTSYYQPLARFSFPVQRKFHWFLEWRWYSLSEPFYLFEGFRTHQYIAGLRLAL